MVCRQPSLSLMEKNEVIVNSYIKQLNDAINLRDNALEECVNHFVEDGEEVEFDGRSRFFPRIVIDCGESTESANVRGVMKDFDGDIILLYRSEYDEEGEIYLMSKNILYLDGVSLFKALQSACK